MLLLQWERSKHVVRLADRCNRQCPSHHDKTFFRAVNTFMQASTSLSSTAATHRYALLVAPGLTPVAIGALEEEAGLTAAAGVSIAMRPLPEIPKGFEKGAAGGMEPLEIYTDALLTPSQLISPVVMAALALVLHADCEVDNADPTVASRAVALLLEQASTSWAAAVSLWRSYAVPRAPVPVRFRVAALRGGKHACSSKALAAAVGEAILSHQPTWTVELEEPDLLVLLIVVQRRVLIGLALPPFTARKSMVLPPEPRPFLTAGYEAGEGHRPHMKPSRAATLVRLLLGSSWSEDAVTSSTASSSASAHTNTSMQHPRCRVLLDPCGGIGILAIEV